MCVSTKICVILRVKFNDAWYYNSMLLIPNTNSASHKHTYSVQDGFTFSVAVYVTCNC